LFVDPVAALGAIDVVDLDADGAGVDGAGFVGVFAVAFEFWRGARAEETQGVKVAFEVSPLAVGSENTFAFRIRAIGRGTVRDRAGSLRFRGHRSAVTSIKDAGGTVLDSGLKIKVRPAKTFTTGGTGEHRGTPKQKALRFTLSLRR
jgi:hypothetical protein